MAMVPKQCAAGACAWRACISWSAPSLVWAKPTRSAAKAVSTEQEVQTDGSGRTSPEVVELRWGGYAEARSGCANIIDPCGDGAAPTVIVSVCQLPMCLLNTAQEVTTSNSQTARCVRVVSAMAYGGPHC